MKKFISAITSLGIAASMIGAVVPATAGAADASKGFAVKTYDIAKPSSADAASTVTIKKSDIPADGYVLPSALYYSESANGSTDSLLVGITTDSKDISFKLYNPEKDGYTKSEQEYTLGGTKFSTSSYISFAGSYDDLDGYMAAGKHVFGIDSSQTAAGTDNYYIGLSWTNNGKEYKWAGEKSDSYPLYVFDTIIPQSIAVGTYTIKYCEYNTDTTGVNYNPCPLVEGEKQRYTTKDGNLKLETMTINIVDANGSTPSTTTTTSATTTTTTTTTAKPVSQDGDIQFTFADKDGKTSIEAKPGDELVINANITANGKPVSAMDVQFQLGSGLKLQQISGKSAAIGNSAVSTNEDDCRANFTAINDEDGEPIVPTDGKAALTLKVKVADNASGDYTIGFSELKVYKDNTNYTYKSSFAPISIKVSGGGQGQQSEGADINFTFADKDGNSEISAKPGDEITVYANVTANGKPVSAMDVQFKTDSSVKITKLGSKAPALDGASASTNEDEGRVNFTSIGSDGEPVIPTDGKAAFTLVVKITDDATNGKHTIGFSECKVFQDSTNFNYKTAYKPLTITVTGGKDVKYTLGDVNNDGIINAVDASQVLKYYAKVSTGGDGGFTEEQKLAANVNGDGVIDAVDAAKILSYYAYASTIKDGTPVSMEDFMAGKK